MISMNQTNSSIMKQYYSFILHFYTIDLHNFLVEIFSSWKYNQDRIANRIKIQDWHLFRFWASWGFCSRTWRKLCGCICLNCRMYFFSYLSGFPLRTPYRILFPSIKWSSDVRNLTYFPYFISFCSHWIYSEVVNLFSDVCERNE